MMGPQSARGRGGYRHERRNGHDVIGLVRAQAKDAPPGRAIGPLRATRDPAWPPIWCGSIQTVVTRHRGVARLSVEPYVQLIETQFTLPPISQILQTYAPVEVQCRCGTQVRRGEPVVSLTAVPWSLQAQLLGGAFCSRRCLRAFLLETLETLDAIAPPNSVSRITDLLDLHTLVASTLAGPAC